MVVVNPFVRARFSDKTYDADTSQFETSKRSGDALTMSCRPNERPFDCVSITWSNADATREPACATAPLPGTMPDTGTNTSRPSLGSANDGLGLRFRSTRDGWSRLSEYVPSTEYIRRLYSDAYERFPRQLCGAVYAPSINRTFGAVCEKSTVDAAVHDPGTAPVLAR